jgi:hypothetical protein
MSDGVLETDGRLVDFLYRIEDGDGYFYSSVRRVEAKHNIELVGLAARPGGDRIRSAESREAFREHVDAFATDSRWFDEPVATNGHIAELLYRTSWGEDANLYASRRDEEQLYSHTIIGVVVRPKRQTVDSTKWGRDEFEDNVRAVAEAVVWFDAPKATIAGGETA